MRKIVLPLVETERSLLALQYVKKHFSPTQAEIILVMVDESLPISATREEEAAAQSMVEQKLELIAKVLEGYQIITKGYVGKAGPCIIKTSREYNADYIVMTKSAQPDMLSMVGRTTDYVLNNAYCNVLIVSENKLNAGEYKGLIYKKAQAVVNLRGQIGDKQSECLLPSVDADCNYHFEVTVGKIRFFHTTYNPETSNWDLPPSGDQIASIDVAAGETADLLVKANSVDGKADRIRIINRGMKQEAVFSYKITAAKAPAPLEIPAAPGAMPAPAVINLESGEVVQDAEPVAEELAIGLEILAEEPVQEPEVQSYGLPIEDTEYMVEDTVAIDIPEEDPEAEVAEPTIEIAGPVQEPTIEVPAAVEEPEVVEEELEAVEEEPEVAEEEPEVVEEEPEVIEEEPAAEESAEPEVEVVEEAAEPEVDDVAEGISSTFPDDIFEMLDELASEDLASGTNGSAVASEIDPAFDDLFGEMPSPEPIDEVSVATLQHNFDEIINEFRTGQINYIAEEPEFFTDLEEYTKNGDDQEPEDKY